MTAVSTISVSGLGSHRQILKFNTSYYYIDRSTGSPRGSSVQRDFRDERFTVRMHGKVSKRSSKPSLRESVGKSKIERERERGREACALSLSLSSFLLPSSPFTPPPPIALVVSSKYFYVPTISYTLPLYTLYIYLRGMYARERTSAYVRTYIYVMYVHRGPRGT